MLSWGQGYKPQHTNLHLSIWNRLSNERVKERKTESSIWDRNTALFLWAWKDVCLTTFQSIKHFTLNCPLEDDECNCIHPRMCYQPVANLEKCHNSPLDSEMTDGPWGKRCKADSEWHALVVCIIPPTLNTLTSACNPQGAQQGKVASCGCLASGGKRWGWSMVVKEWPFTYYFLMEKCLLTTLCVGGLSAKSPFVTLICVLWNPHNMLLYS